MHIPSSMLNGTICPVTAVVSALSIGGVTFAAAKAKGKPGAMRFGAVSAFIFAAQMMNFPIQNGTSGHLLGGVLASALLGVPFGVLAMALVLLIQTFVFSDGGTSVLGANILNMALIGAGIGGLLFRSLVGTSTRNSMHHLFAMGMAAWLSTVVAALVCSVELGISGAIPFSIVAGAMIGVHAFIGIGEGLITIMVYQLLVAKSFEMSSKWTVSLPALSLAIIGAMLTPFACSFPDGLEWVGKKYQFFHESAPSFISPLANYTVSFISHPKISTELAGLSGVLITFLGAWLLANMLNWTRLSILEKEV